MAKKNSYTSGDDDDDIVNHLIERSPDFRQFLEERNRAIGQGGYVSLAEAKRQLVGEE